MQSTESKDTPRMTESGRLIGPKEAIAIDTAPFSGLDQHYYQLWLRGSDTIDGLEAALAAERDRADRAEAKLVGIRNKANREVWISGALWALRDQGFQTDVYLRDAVSSNCPFPDDAGAAA